MQNFSASPREMAASLWRNRQLIRNLFHREVVGRYKGSMLGIFWSLATPIFMLAVYTFVFSVVFKARWPAPLGVLRGSRGLAMGLTMSSERTPSLHLLADKKYNL